MKFKFSWHFAVYMDEGLIYRAIKVLDGFM